MFHLFIQSEVAKAVWKCFGEIFRMLYTFLSIANAIALWMPMTRAQFCFDIRRTVIVGYIFKEVWNSRCRALFQGEEDRVEGFNPNAIDSLHLHTSKADF